MPVPFLPLPPFVFSQEPEPNELPKWSNAKHPPAPGDIVRISGNGIGKARVLGYFLEEGWLGVHVMPLDPPEWYVKQNGRVACWVFGAEIKY